jgi:hypothetical protein
VLRVPRSVGPQRVVDPWPVPLSPEAHPVRASLPSSWLPFPRGSSPRWLGGIRPVHRPR